MSSPSVHQLLLAELLSQMVDALRLQQANAPVAFEQGCITPFSVGSHYTLAPGLTLVEDPSFEALLLVSLTYFNIDANDPNRHEPCISSC